MAVVKKNTIKVPIILTPHQPDLLNSRSQTCLAGTPFAFLEYWIYLNTKHISKYKYIDKCS